MTQPVKRQPAKRQPVRRQPAQSEPADREPAKRQPAKRQPAKRQPAKREPAKRQPTNGSASANRPVPNGAALVNGFVPINPVNGVNGSASLGALRPINGTASRNGVPVDVVIDDATEPTTRKPRAPRVARTPSSTGPARTRTSEPKAGTAPTKPQPTKAQPTRQRRRDQAAAAVLNPAQALSHQVDVWDQRVAGALNFLRRRLTGDYQIDEFGFDPDLTEALVHPALRLLYQRYFRVEVSGAENLPEHGPALIVANHSGTVPLDALMLSMAVHDETPTGRHMRLLGADLVFRMPILSEVARKGGATLACNPDAERLLRTNNLVGVFPEGFKGIGKPYRDRYQLQRFGRGGFVSAALRTGTPIVPASIVGAEEIYPIIGNLRPLAKMIGLPYFPVTPLFPLLGPLGAVPLPSKWLIEFGEPISTADLSADADDPIVVFNLADQVRETIQHTLHRLLERRPDPFGR